MKKTLLATAIGLSLAATQAFAQAGAAPRVADRIGPTAGPADELAGRIPAGLIFAAATVVGFVIITEAGDDDSESD